MYSTDTCIHDSCCICLDTSIQDSFAEMKCCNIKIHNECLFKIITYRFYHCPLCRKQLNIDVSGEPNVYRLVYIITFLFYRLPRFRRLVNSLRCQYLCAILFLIAFYSVLFVLLINFEIYSHKLYLYHHGNSSNQNYT